jgi:RNA polymerase sigma factor FliA
MYDVPMRETTGTSAAAPAPHPRLSEAECERLIAQHTPLVSAIARSLLRRLPPHIEADDLMQDGFVGLLVAVLQATTAHAGHHYHSYLAQRIRGAMLDGLRENDPASRSVRRRMREVEVAIHRLGHRLGRLPHEGEVAEALDMPLADYQHLLQQADGYTLFSLEDFDDANADRDFMEWCAATNSNPLAALERKVVQRTLLRALSSLGEREEAVMKAYYVDGLNMREIGARLQITESRVSQIHTQAIARLRAAVLGDEACPSPLAPRWRVS